MFDWIGLEVTVVVVEAIRDCRFFFRRGCLFLDRDTLLYYLVYFSLSSKISIVRIVNSLSRSTVNLVYLHFTRI